MNLYRDSYCHENLLPNNCNTSPWLVKECISKNFINIIKIIKMPISRKEQWIQIAELDKNDRICFTPEFENIMGDLGWEAKAFVGHLLGLWYDPFEHILDYTSGDAKFTKDQPGKFDRNSLDEPQDVVEYWAKKWSKNDKFHQLPHEAGTGLGLDVDWYRDVLRAKLVSIKLPKRLLIAYKDKMIEREQKFEEEFESSITLKK